MVAVYYIRGEDLFGKNYYLQIEKKIQICEQNTIIYYDIKTPSIKADLNTM